MKLGLSLSVNSVSGAKSEPLTDLNDIAGLQLWYKNLNGLSTVAGETDYNNFVTGDVMQWQSQVGSNLLHNDQNYNRPQWSESKMACDFKGSKHFDFTNQISNSGDFTFTFSIRFDSVSVANGILGGTSHNMFELEDEHTFQFRAGGTAQLELVSTSEIVINRWYEVALRRNSGTVDVMVNGVGIVNEQWDTGTDSDTIELDHVGGWNGGGVSELDGYIRDMAYYNVALNDLQIKNIFGLYGSY
tara:strand:+ start:2897 stop:3628 length:732 start_codon:yes stop_codon:yes gene_type:complete